MDAETRAELATLRERAYGRSSDIAGDPAALQRLAELEARVAAVQQLAPADPEPVESEPDAVAVAAEPAEPAEPAAAADAPASAASGLPRWVKVTAPLAALALVVVAAVVTTLVVGASSPYAGMQRVDRLGILEGVELADAPPLAFSPHGERFRGFHGYAVTTHDMPSGAERGYRCLVVQSSPAEDPNRSDMNSNCSADPFPVTVTVILSNRSPEQALAAYPVGTALLFARHGSSVDVYADEPEP